MLQIDDIHVVFHPNTPSEVRALHGFTLNVKQGDFITIIGANGAGKSTLFNAIAGTVTPERGTITLNNQDITYWAEHKRSTVIGRVFQNPALGTCPGLTIEENLSLAAMRGKRKGLGAGVKKINRDWFRNELRFVEMGLEDRLDTDVALLSGGQRQAITLIMATLTKPNILLLDEHTAALDPNAATQIIDLTEKIAAETNITVIMITHSMQQACDIGKRVVMMNRGQVLFEIKGSERDNLTVEDLVGRFRTLKDTGDNLTDRSLLE
jgi:putative ABC transport system ATP-binding protein